MSQKCVTAVTNKYSLFLLTLHNLWGNHCKMGFPVLRTSLGSVSLGPVLGDDFSPTMHIPHYIPNYNKTWYFTLGSWPRGTQWQVAWFGHRNGYWKFYRSMNVALMCALSSEWKIREFEKIVHKHSFFSNHLHKLTYHLWTFQAMPSYINKGFGNTMFWTRAKYLTLMLKHNEHLSNCFPVIISHIYH